MKKLWLFFKNLFRLLSYYVAGNTIPAPPQSEIPTVPDLSKPPFVTRIRRTRKNSRDALFVSGAWPAAEAYRELARTKEPKKHRYLSL